MHFLNTQRRPVRRAVRRSIVSGMLAGAVAFALVLVVPTIGSARSQAAPMNTAEPQISGSAVQGQTLTATTGSWSNVPASFAFEWLRCPQNGGQGNGSDCAPIPFATASTYTPTVADVGYTIRVRVTASNGDGSGSGVSNATGVVQSAAAEPVNTAEPTVSGTARQGQTLFASTGTWSNNPTSFTYQWLRCPQSGGQGDGSGCAVIGGANANGYTVAAADVNFRLRVRVTASNTAGGASAASNATGIVQASASAPKNTVPPRITGSPVVNQVLTATRGDWTGSSPISFGYQWQRCDQFGASCGPITGAVGSTWRLTLASVGHTIRVRVTATNSGGSTQATSVPTAVVSATTPTPPVTTGCPAGRDPVNVNDVKAPARLLIDGQQASPQSVQPSTREMIVRYHVSNTCGQSVAGALVYATATPYNQFAIPREQPTNATGWAELHFITLAGFPVNSQQGLVTMFVRARKSGENLLAGISTRRLFSIRVSQ